MQLNNGVIKVEPKPSISLGDKGSVSYQDKSEVNLDTFDLSDFLIPTLSKKDMALKPSDKNAKQLVVDAYLAETSQLFALGQKYEIEVVARGHQALYELLSSIYSLALRIEEHELSEKIMASIRGDLKDKYDVKINTNSSPVAALVRYVVRGDKTAASRYSKVLSVARAENLSPEELPAYIARRGGVAQIHDTEVKQLAKKTGDQHSKERIDLIREYFNLLGVTSKMDFKFDGSVLIHNDEKTGAAETSSFCVFIAHYVGDNEYKMISANDLGKTYEDNLIRYLGKAMPNDLHVLERGIRNFKRKISMDESQPKSLQDAMKRVLEKPMKYKEDAIIEMETPIDEEK